MMMLILFLWVSEPCTSLKASVVYCHLHNSFLDSLFQLCLSGLLSTCHEFVVRLSNRVCMKGVASIMEFTRI